MDDDSSDTAYTELGNVSPADLMSFAYQIASGMVYLENNLFNVLLLRAT